MYFALITIGIATSVRTKWAIQLIVVIIIIIALSKILQNFFNKNGRSFYNTSFNEGTNLNTIEVFTNEKIELIEKDIHLDSSYNNKLQNEFVYRLAFENKKDLEILKKKIEGLKNISKINTNYN